MKTNGQINKNVSLSQRKSNVIFIRSPKQGLGKRGRIRKGRGKGKSRRVKRINEGGNMIVRNNPRFPNAVKQIPIHNRVIRYVTGATASNQGVTPRDLLRQLATVTNGSTAVTSIIGSIRLRRVSLYFVGTDNDFSANNVILSFQWQGSMNAPEELITDRGTATQPACIKVKPPVESLANFFFDPNSADFTSNIFIFSAPAKTVIDIDFDFTLVNGDAHTGTLSAAASITGVIVSYLAGDADYLPDGGVAVGRWT